MTYLNHVGVGAALAEIKEIMGIIVIFKKLTNSIANMCFTHVHDV